VPHHTPPQAFFLRSGEELHPVPESRSPWSADMLHGRLLAGLAARAVERDHAAPQYQVARLTVDLFRRAPMEAVRIRSSVVRDGHRVRAVEVALHVAGREVARAHALLLRRSGPPAGTVWTAPAWSAPDPGGVPASRARADGPVDSPDLRLIEASGFDTADRRQAWLRDDRELVDGEPLTPVTRAAMAADVANPLANWSDVGLHYINADVTLSLARDPRGAWIGLEVTDHLEADGIAVGQCNLYDAGGRVGHCEVSAVATQAFGAP